MEPPPPPPPPPHGSGPGNNRAGLPDGNYDIFIIPPHSSGSGFLYLPSLQPHRNSFLAGVGVTLMAVAVWTIVFPVLRQWLATIVASGGAGVIFLMIGMGVAGWAWGKTQMENVKGTEGGGSAGASNAHTQGQSSTGPMPGAPPPGSPPPNASGFASGSNPNAGFGATPRSASSGPQAAPSDPPPRPKPTWTRSTPGADTNSPKTSWEKAREETRRKEEERKRTEELRKKREEEEKERQKQREREARERELRELREAREKREKEAKAAKEAEELRKAREEKASARASATSRPASPTKRHQQPTARTETEEETYSFRPYDKPPKVPTHKSGSASSVYSSSYAPSMSTARSTPPPSHRGPYTTKDPDKIVIKAVYTFNNAFMKLPISQLVSGQGAVTDGLILRITTEGLFIDDDVRGVPQREWDVKAWTLKLVESAEYKSLHVLRASIRDQEGKRYVFVLQEEEGWKVAVGLQRLRRGTQVRALGVSGLPMNECRAMLENMGWV